MRYLPHKMDWEDAIPLDLFPKNTGRSELPAEDMLFRRPPEISDPAQHHNGSVLHPRVRLAPTPPAYRLHIFLHKRLASQTNHFWRRRSHGLSHFPAPDKSPMPVAPAPAWAAPSDPDRRTSPRSQKSLKSALQNRCRFWPHRLTQNHMYQYKGWKMRILQIHKGRRPIGSKSPEPIVSSVIPPLSFSVHYSKIRPEFQFFDILNFLKKQRIGYIFLYGLRLTAHTIFGRVLPTVWKRASCAGSQPCKDGKPSRPLHNKKPHQRTDGGHPSKDETVFQTSHVRVKRSAT